MVRRLVAAAVSAAWVAALLVALTVPALAAAEDEVGIGLPAPGFSAKTLNPEAAGSPWIRLDQYVGDEPDDAGARVVLLSFFASWCGPCQKELPFLVQLDRMYRDQGLRVVSVSIDTAPDGIETCRQQAVAAKVVHPVVSDRYNLIARRYLGEETKLPSVFLVGRDGNVLRIERGYAKDAAAFLMAEVQQALGLKPARAAAPATSQR
jgi:thiol-disulfide isomerase/thioredoxin